MSNLASSSPRRTIRTSTSAKPNSPKANSALRPTQPQLSQDQLGPKTNSALRPTQPPTLPRPTRPQDQLVEGFWAIEAATTC